MPLLNQAPFVPKPFPVDLKPDEEVFFCHYTKEVFRNYDEFFNRQFLCKSSVWTCEYTGQSGLTYEQALKSEQEVTASLNSIQDCHKKAMVSLVHHSFRMNINNIIGEVFLFFKERYVVGEELDYHPVIGNKKLSRRAKVIQVIQPQQPPVKLQVITAEPSPKPLPPTAPPQSGPSPVSENGTPASSVTNREQNLKLCVTPIKKTPVKAHPPSSPISPEVNLIPRDYQYVCTFVDDPEQPFTCSSVHLSRPKNALTKEKIKLFLKNSLYRVSDKHPLIVKAEYVSKFQLGPSMVIADQHAPPKLLSGPRKRSLSQTSLDGFLTPSASKKPCPFIFNPAIKGLSSKGRRNSSLTKSPLKRRKSKTPSKPSASPKTPKTPKTPKISKTPTAKPSSAASIGAKKILKKTKHLKQLDLRRSLVSKSVDRRLSDTELLMRKRCAEESKAQRLAEKEKLKEKLRQDRLRRSLELKEMRKQERLRRIEWMKPREDLLCEDNKPLPLVSCLHSPLPNELFGDAAMIMEFIHHYGPAFNIKDAISSQITYDKIEDALLSCSTETVLFDLIKFLLQAIFSAMEEEHEDTVRSDDGEGVSTPTATTATVPPITGSEDIQDGACTTSRTGSRRSSVGSIPVEGMEDQQQHQQISNINLAGLKVLATEHAKWPYLTQATPLHKLVLNVCTCSEVLRLHLLSCGGYKNSSDRQWFRFCNRGGYTDSDDPVVELQLSNPALIETLATKSIFDLKAKEKAKIISCLCSQLLMFSSSREVMEDILTQVKQLRKQLRELQYSLGANKKKSKPSAPKDEEEGKDAVNGIEEVKPVDEKSEVTSDHVEKTNEESEESRKARITEEMKQLEKELFPLMAAIRHKPLGCDRFHNRYWVFPSVPGLYIEHSDKSSELFDTPLHTSPTKMEINGEIEDTVSHRTICVCDTSSCHDLSLPCNSLWSVVSSSEDLESILSALNPRGIRESKLKQAIEKVKEQITSQLTQSPFITGSDERQVPQFIYRCAGDSLELQLREQILDIEEKLYMGNLGYVRETASRREWRERIENSGAAGLYAVKNNGIVVVNGMSSSNEPEEEVADEEQNPVMELSKALLQIQFGIEKKYLLSPLGTAVDMKKRGKDVRKNGVTSNAPICLEQWRASLQKATSFSQIFVHLATLERAVAWSKSLMKVRCRLCRRKGGDEYMLLCDGCDHGYHTYCLRPPLSRVPEGDWFCYDCCPVTPVKRRRTVSMVSLKELSESESEEDPEAYEEEEDEGGRADDQDEDSEPEGTRRKGLRSSTRIQTKASQNVKRGGERSGGNNGSRKCYGRERGLHSSRKRLKIDEESSSGGSSSSSSANSSLSQAEMIISAIIDIRCSKKGGPSQTKAQHTLELQLCKAILDEMIAHGDSWPFLKPVRRREFPDYHEVVTRAMDLKTIGHNISTHKYRGLDEFLSDVDLIFVNCSTYHKRHSKIAKAGAALRRFVEQRYSDLGLGNLASVTISGMKHLPGLRSSSHH